jgi:hypothetical protein
MATTRVNISGLALFKALHTPGGSGGVRDYVDNQAVQTIQEAIRTAPVNKRGNAMHRGGKVGTYKASFHWDRRGSNKTSSQATVWNSAGHAWYVEFGRRASHRPEVFSWTRHIPRNSISLHEKGTSARKGKHILERALNWAYVTPGGSGGAFVRPPGV